MKTIHIDLYSTSFSKPNFAHMFSKPWSPLGLGAITHVISIEHVINAAVVYIATYIPALFSILLRSSMYTINKYGNKIPPCRTPFETLKNSDVVEPHFIQKVWVLYQYNRIRISTTGTPRWSNFLKASSGWLCQLLLKRIKNMNIQGYCYFYNTE